MRTLIHAALLALLATPALTAADVTPATALSACAAFRAEVLDQAKRYAWQVQRHEHPAEPLALLTLYLDLMRDHKCMLPAEPFLMLYRPHAALCERAAQRVEKGAVPLECDRATWKADREAQVFPVTKASR